MAESESSPQEKGSYTHPQLPTGHHERNMVGPPKEAGMQWLTMCSRNEVINISAFNEDRKENSLEETSLC